MKVVAMEAVQYVLDRLKKNKYLVLARQRKLDASKCAGNNTPQPRTLRKKQPILVRCFTDSES